MAIDINAANKTHIQDNAQTESDISKYTGNAGVQNSLEGAAVGQNKSMEASEALGSQLSQNANTYGQQTGVQNTNLINKTGVANGVNTGNAANAAAKNAAAGQAGATSAGVVNQALTAARSSGMAGPKAAMMAGQQAGNAYQTAYANAYDTQLNNYNTNIQNQQNLTSQQMANAQNAYTNNVNNEQQLYKDYNDRVFDSGIKRLDADIEKEKLNDAEYQNQFARDVQTQDKDKKSQEAEVGYYPGQKGVETTDREDSGWGDENSKYSTNGGTTNGGNSDNNKEEETKKEDDTKKEDNNETGQSDNNGYPINKDESASGASEATSVSGNKISEKLKSIFDKLKTKADEYDTEKTKQGEAKKLANAVEEGKDVTSTTTENGATINNITDNTGNSGYKDKNGNPVSKKDLPSPPSDKMTTADYQKWLASQGYSVDSGSSSSNSASYQGPTGPTYSPGGAPIQGSDAYAAAMAAEEKKQQGMAQQQSEAQSGKRGVSDERLKNYYDISTRLMDKYNKSKRHYSDLMWRRK